MKIIGLTGPTGAGKSTLCARFEELNIPCINTDEVYHKLTSSPSPCLDELKNVFGDKIINENGSLNRKALASVVFEGENKESNLSLLNSITHKYVWEETKAILTLHKNNGKVATVIDAPALFSAKVFVEACDFILSVLCDKEIRAERIIARDNISYEQAMARINAQPGDEFFIQNSDYYIYSTSDIESTAKQLDSILIKEEIYTNEKEQA